MALYNTPSPVTRASDVNQIVAGRPRQFLTAEFTGDTAAAGDFVEVPQIVAGDIGPTAEPQYEDFTFFDGTRAQARNGDTLPTKTARIKLPDTHPVMVTYYKYEDSDSNPNPERGQYLAYNIFNPDGSGSKGEYKINSINAVGEGTHAYDVVFAYRNKERIPSSENPVPVTTG